MARGAILHLTPKHGVSPARLAVANYLRDEERLIGRAVELHRIANVGFGLAALDLPVLLNIEIYTWVADAKYTPKLALLWKAMTICKRRKER